LSHWPNIVFFTGLQSRKTAAEDDALGEKKGNDCLVGMMIRVARFMTIT
jgi:hypothetical protein